MTESLPVGMNLRVPLPDVNKFVISLQPSVDVHGPPVTGPDGLVEFDQLSSPMVGRWNYIS